MFVFVDSLAIMLCIFMFILADSVVIMYNYVCVLLTVLLLCIFMFILADSVAIMYNYVCFC